MPPDIPFPSRKGWLALKKKGAAAAARSVSKNDGVSAKRVDASDASQTKKRPQRNFPMGPLTILVSIDVSGNDWIVDKIISKLTIAISAESN